MSLVLQYRWEHALIAATVEAASSKCPDCYLGRTAIQKLLYFMNVSGVPMEYSFDIHHYGPFCASVMHDVEWLFADEVIEDQSQDESRYSNYKPGPGWSELAEQYKDSLAEHQDIVTSVCDALGDMSPETLELISTLDFSYRWVHARGGQGPWRQLAIEKFKSIKKDKFPDDEIDGWYDTLVKAKLIRG
jgi:uncharacterized protein YwgA